MIGGNPNKLLKQGESHSEKLHLLYSKLCGELRNNPKLIKEITGKKEEIINRQRNTIPSKNAILQKVHTQSS